ncbi:GMC oxidoreductase [Xylona heveae TC161]|uniref:GMC oxidoreductase n=1 Tax=Xylona heveae (strain CBS 132557 / TC161) TaxID=1328760 RepID=A0A165AAJ4_XYLHT|nr:GMC oxidoreductase [Xylona heveae TC161]KZF20175.1 GMC oxidoreductase [Xylona heveae TC161]
MGLLPSLLGLVAALSIASGTPLGKQLSARDSDDSSFGAPGDASYDYVVVGGGNAGLTIAARLAENPQVSVAVVEAGGFYETDAANLSVPAFDTYWDGKDPSDTNPLIDWGFVTTPQEGALNAKIHYARGKTLGGCSARNYMAYQRGTVDSYKKWADQVGDSSYEFDQFLPYFEKSLGFAPPDYSKRASNATPEYDLATMGNPSGPLSVTFSNFALAMSSWVQRAFKEIGIEPINGFTSGKLIGSSYVLETIDHATQHRESSETAFLRPRLGKAKNLIVYKNTLAKRVVFDGTRATGVEVDSDNQQYTLSANKEVILSAGAFQSPQLLMVSGVGPSDTLKQYGIPVVADRPGVGQNMWDHVLMGPSYRVNAITSSSFTNPEFLQEAEREYNEEQAGILTNSGGDFLAWEKIPDSLRSSFSSDTQGALSEFPEDWPEVEYISMNGYLGDQENFIKGGPTDGYNYASVSVALVAPLSRGTVGISSADMADPPVIDPKWLTHPADQAVAVAGYKRVRQMFNTTAIEPALIGPEYFPGPQVQSDEDLLHTIQQTVSTVYHASCTCAMGQADDENAVVDSKARVIGVENLRVVDASSFPFLPPGHPMSTVYALAEKIACDILSE